MKQKGIYADIMERELYNGILSGIQLDGKKYFYVNPLEVQPEISGKVYGYKHVRPTRPGWYACACCPTNLVRFIGSLGKYCWTESDSTIYSHLFIGQNVTLKKAEIMVESKYPWEGSVRYFVKSACPEQFTFAVHIPGFVKQDDEKIIVKLNGETVKLHEHMKDGYLYLTRIWKEGDEVEIYFELPVRKIYANTNVRDDAGCTALMRVLLCIVLKRQITVKIFGICGFLKKWKQKLICAGRVS